MGIDVGQLLKEWRKARKYTQAFVAAALGVERKTVNRWETGQTQITVAQLIALSDLYGMDWQDIFRRSNVVPADLSLRHWQDVHRRIEVSLKDLDATQLRVVLYMIALMTGKHPDTI